MTPGQCNSLEGKRLLIRAPKEGAMIADYVFDTPEGVAWLEAGCLHANQWVTGVHYHTGEVYPLEAGCWVLETTRNEVVFLDVITDDVPTGDRQTARKLLEQELGICLAP